MKELTEGHMWRHNASMQLDVWPTSSASHTRSGVKKFVYIRECEWRCNCHSPCERSPSHGVAAQLEPVSRARRSGSLVAGYKTKGKQS